MTQATVGLPEQKAHRESSGMCRLIEYSFVSSYLNIQFWQKRVAGRDFSVAGMFPNLVASLL